MITDLKQHTLQDLHRELHSLAFSLNIGEISRWTYNNRSGKINAEIARREAQTKNAA